MVPALYKAPLAALEKEGEPRLSGRIDFVVHGGGSMSGEYLHSLVVTDVCSGWVEAVPLLAREQSLVIEGLDRIREQLPVVMRGIDSDNDGAFINDTLATYCQVGRHNLYAVAAPPLERSGVDRAEERGGDPPNGGP
jgi:hypothetical protein